MHRDLKPQSLLVLRGRRLKPTYFGLVWAFYPQIWPLTKEVVMMWYRPPEILLGSQTYATPFDVWPIGTIFVEMVTKRPLFPGYSYIDQLFRISRYLVTPDEEAWPGVTQMKYWNTYFPRWYRSDYVMNEVDRPVG